MDSSARLGPYEIKGFLTDVGLDDLYLGNDTRRDVEILLRVLSVFVNEEETVERLRQRAQHIGTIDNEHLLALSTIKKSDGAVLAIAVRPPGLALDHFIPAEGLLSRDVFDLSLALASAVTALHREGLVHGYLHPGRVIVSDDRQLKLLVIGPEEAGRTPTPGAAACRAPEVLDGAAIDAQAEVFSLGVLLHLIATGKMPFSGATAEELEAAIRDEVPPPVTDVRPDLPRELAMVIARCLKKDRELRYAASADVYSALVELKDAIVEGKVAVARQGAAKPKAEATYTAAPTRAALPARAAATLGSARLLLDNGPMLAAGAGLLLAGLALGWLLGGNSGPSGSSAPALSRATTATGPELFPRLSPDGQMLYYARAEDGDWGVYAQPVGGGAAVELTADSPFGDSQPALSPDGARIAFRSEREGGGIFVMSSQGGAAQRVAGFGHNPSWSPDGRSLVVADSPVYDLPYPGASGEIAVLDLATGQKRVLQGASGMQPDWSPGGEHIAYWSSRSATASDIWTVPAEGGEPVRVTDHISADWNPAWSPAGDFLYFVSNRSGSTDIWRVAVDSGSGEAVGEPEPVTISGGVRAVHPSFARETGAMVYAEVTGQRHIYRIPFDPAAGMVTGLPEMVPGLPRDAFAPDVAPDGNRIAFVRRTGSTDQVWVADLRGGAAVPITDGKSPAHKPRISPNGRNVAFLSEQSGSVQLWTAPAAGGSAQRLTELNTRRVSQPTWSRDGAGIGMSVGGAMLPSYTLLFDPGQAPERQVADTLLSTPSTGTFEPHSWSRDGGRIAGSIRDGDGQFAGIAVLQVGAEQYQGLTEFGMHPVWLRDDRRLLFQWGQSLYLVDSRSPEPRQVYSSVPDALGEVFSLSADDRWIYVSLERQEADAWLLRR